MESKRRLSAMFPVIFITIVLTTAVVSYVNNFRLWNERHAKSDPSTVESKEAGTSELRPIEEPETKSDGDLTEMVLIPAGEFQMGSNDGENSEKPVHTVYLDAFYIDKYEVTNAQYRLFVQDTNYGEPEGCGYINGRLQSHFRPWADKSFNGEHQPVVCVSWADARVYCEWAGKRLPTEAEWEKAARGGFMGKRYPWGDEITHDKANFPGIEGADKWEGPAPVNSFEPNGYGLYNIAGNVWEWCDDWYDENYYSISPENNPRGPKSGIYRVLRGGSWSSSFNFLLRVSLRNYTNQPLGTYNVGFRCGMSRSD